MEKVYIVSCGSYSDWRILHIFRNKEKAYYYHSLCNAYDLNEVEEYEISDDILFEPIYYVDFKYAIMDLVDDSDFRKYSKQNYEINVCNSNTLESTFDSLTKTRYNNGIIHLLRPIKNNKYSINDLENKYLKVCYDLEAKIRYELQNGLNKYDINKLFYDKNIDIFE